MKKNTPLIILISLLISFNFLYASESSTLETVEQIKKEICKEYSYSYVNINQNDLKIDPSTDFLKIKDDNTFEYVLTSAKKNERGNWYLINNTLIK